jgi:hypothetical protein
MSLAPQVQALVDAVAAQGAAITAATTEWHCAQWTASSCLSSRLCP